MIVRRWSIMFMKIAALFNSTKTNTLYAIQLLIVSSLDMSTQIIHATLNIATPLCRCLSQSAITFHIHIIMSCEQSNNSGYNIQHTVITLANSHLHPMHAKRSISISDHAIYFLPLNGVWCGMTSCIMCSLTTVICNKAVAITYLKFLLTQRCLTKLLPEGVFCVPISISSLYLYVDDDGCIVI